jgi:hypothetical protein
MNRLVEVTHNTEVNLDTTTEELYCNRRHGEQNPATKHTYVGIPLGDRQVAHISETLRYISTY